MRRITPALILVLVSACVAQPPERGTLPDVSEVVDEPVGCRLSVGEPMGVAVISVIEPSAASGILESGDVITEVDGVRMVTRSDLTGLMAEHAPGDVVEFGYTRDGEPETASITLGENPNEPSRAMIGVTIETAYDQIGPDEADDVIAPSVSARPIHLGDTILLFDPLVHTWQQTGITPPEETRWVSTSTGIYAVEGEGPVQILDLMSGETIEDDGFEGWSPLRLIGVVGDDLIVVVSMDVDDQPGFVNLAIAGFNPTTATTSWVAPIPNTFGVPVAAHGSPNGSGFVLVGAEPDSNEQTGVVLYNALGLTVGTEDLTGFGTPMGWFDSQSMAFRTNEEEITVYDFAEASTETYTLPQNATATVATTVADGINILAVAGRDLFLQGLTDTSFSAPLASNCNIGRAGDPGWGT